jgi:RNA polymerase sigma-70 factor (ECF subfamily)
VRQPLAPELHALVARGRGAWPELGLDDARFAAHLAARLPPDGSPLFVEDLYLACACIDGRPRALAVFDERHLASLGRHLGRVDASAPFVDDVRQRLRERLFLGSDGEPPRLAGYSGRGPLAAWVKVAAVRLALNLRRDQQAGSARADSDEPMVTSNPEMLLLRQRFRHDFGAAFTAAVATLSVEQRQLLRLHFLDALSLGEIGALHAVDKSTVSRRLQVARETLLAETQRLLRARLAVDDAELSHLIALIRSQLGDLSVSRLLGTQQAS